ncbi:MAG: prolyl oligopeptidase family serine peptidase [Anaerolineae bacterium]|nr:prolyl oligopeptidase family serine peptidase [Anaerolineae bacterium]
MTQQALSFTKEIVKTVHLGYLLHLPSAYDQDPERLWPLILFLHGGGERGADPHVLKIHSIPMIVEAQPDFPFVVLSPQCPADSSWVENLEALDALLEEICSAYRVDRRRLYLTGPSMGGMGTWSYAVAYPERFAAIAPVCGGMRYVNPQRVCVLKDLPVWAFHGALDPIVPLEMSQVLVDALKACGGNVRFTVYPERGHDVHVETYDNPELYDWFLAHSRP